MFYAHARSGRGRLLAAVASHVLMLAGLVALIACDALAVNGGGYLMVHFNPDIVYTPDYPDPGYYFDLFDVGCPGIAPDSCRQYVQWKECSYGGDFDPTYTADAIAINGNNPGMLLICAVFPDTTCVELDSAEFGITSVEGDITFVDYGVAGRSEMHSAGWPGAGEGLQVWFDVPETSHVIPLAWIALRPTADGRVHFGGSPWTGSVTFWLNDEVTSTACVDYPNAGCVLAGHNPDTGIPFSRACCIRSQCMLLGQDDCAAIGGYWSPTPGEYCDPNPCPPSEPSGSTWGALRALYRR